MAEGVGIGDACGVDEGVAIKDRRAEEIVCICMRVFIKFHITVN